MNCKLDVLVVDDEQSCINNLVSFLEIYDFVNIVGTAKNSNEFIKIMKLSNVDLVFLDIQINKVCGFDLAEYLNKNHPQTDFIFVTGHIAFAIDGYKYEPIDFLSKPIDLLRLEKSLSKVQKKRNNNSKVSDVKVGLNTNGGFEIIAVDNILYIEKIARKTYIVCIDNKKYESYETIKNYEAIFSKYNFIKCHQSYIVPIDKIVSLTTGVMPHSYYIIVDGCKSKIPVSRSKYNNIKEMIKLKGIDFINK